MVLWGGSRVEFSGGYFTFLHRCELQFGQEPVGCCVERNFGSLAIQFFRAGGGSEGLRSANIVPSIGGKVWSAEVFSKGSSFRFADSLASKGPGIRFEQVSLGQACPS